MEWNCAWQTLIAVAFIAVSSFDESECDCPDQFWDTPSKVCATPLIQFLDHYVPNENWDSISVKANATCTAYQETNACYRRLMDLCRARHEAVRELKIHADRYWVYGRTCTVDHLRRSHRIIECLLPHMRPTRTCTEAYEKYFRSYVVEKQFRNACRVVSTAMKCFHEIKKDITHKCQGSESVSADYQRLYIQPLIDQSRDTVVSKCKLLPPYDQYFNSAPTLTRHRRTPICVLFSPSVVALLLARLRFHHTLNVL